jgi:hypothetical protein
VLLVWLLLLLLLRTAHCRLAQRSEAMRVFGKDLSDQSDWAKWRMTPITWLRLGKRHAEQGHVVLAADCFTEVRVVAPVVCTWAGVGGWVGCARGLRVCLEGWWG